MKRFIRAGVLAAWAALVASGPVLAQDKVVRVPNEDKEMAGAIAKARQSLPEYWKSCEKPAAPNMSCALKVMIRAGGQVEHFWLVNVERKGGGYAGTINNDPNLVKTVKAGQRYEFKEADVTDWMFMRNGKIVGNETMRPLLKRMPADQAARYRQMLEKP